MPNGEKSTYDVVIVGGASAGLTASLYCSRQQLKTVVITKDIGGQALLTNEIQNYPFPVCPDRNQASLLLDIIVC